jgi:SnoaL-like domain
MNEQSVDRDPTTQARGAIEIVCSGDLSRKGDFYSPQFVDNANDAVYYGYDGLLKSFAFYKSIFDGGWRFEVVDQITEGNRVTSRWVIRATCRGREVALPGITLSTVDENGQVREDFGHADSLSLLGQMGVLRSLRLGVEVLIGRVKLPKPARQNASDLAGVGRPTR